MNPAAPGKCQPLIMGVINVTPDSFSDAGDYLDPGAAAEQAYRLVAAGAAVVDVGAESTRPGATPVPEAEEWRRLEPVLLRLLRLDLPGSISVDTRKPALMLRAASLGARWINDVGGNAPFEVLAKLAAYPQMQYIAMHMPLSPEVMQQRPLGPQEAHTAVSDFFAERCATLRSAGFAPEAIWLDPGIGFGKTDAANVQLMQAVSSWSKTWQIAIGISRKSLIGRALGIAHPKDRDGPSKMLELGLAMLGAKLIRTHSVAPLRQLLDLLTEGVND